LVNEGVGANCFQRSDRSLFDGLSALFVSLGVFAFESGFGFADLLVGLVGGSLAT
jgi:hypothetical protein